MAVWRVFMHGNGLFRPRLSFNGNQSIDRRIEGKFQEGY